MEKEKIRVILDTNWYISAAINKKSRRNLFKVISDATLQILYCEELEMEFIEVMKREKFKHIISENQLTRFLNLVLPQLEMVSLRTPVLLRAYLFITLQPYSRAGSYFSCLIKKVSKEIKAVNKLLKFSLLLQ